MVTSGAKKNSVGASDVLNLRFGRSTWEFIAFSHTWKLRERWLACVQHDA
jgi:hypothetical protein